MAKRDEFQQTAAEQFFDNQGDPLCDLLAETTEQAIYELCGRVSDASLALTLFQYNGNANVGRYLEFFSGISSDEAPLYSPQALRITSIVARTTAVSATCNIGFYDLSTPTPTLLYTLTFSNQKDRVVTLMPSVFQLPAMGQLAIKIDSGAIQKPHIYLIIRGV